MQLHAIDAVVHLVLASRSILVTASTICNKLPTGMPIFYLPRGSINKVIFLLL
jgi:hypothetical protein